MKKLTAKQKLHLKHRRQGKIPPGMARSNRWPTVRKNFLLKNPVCVVCGGNKQLEVHHKKPFHLHPQLELDPKNLITLCEELKDGVNCHLFIGHAGNFKGYNADVAGDAPQWADKIKRSRAIYKKNAK